MISNCDRYWWRLNKVSFIILLCTLPIALLFPVTSLIMPMVFLYGTCDKYLVFHNCGEVQDDSMRFILTMPFSREQVFNTYIKALTVTSLGYAFILGLIRLILTLTKVSKIDNGYQLISYMAILLICLLITCLFLIFLINNYTITLKSTYLCKSLFVVQPLLWVLPFLKSIIMFATGFTRMKMGVNYDFSDILNMGITEKFASIFSVIIFLIVLIFLLYAFINAIAKGRKKYVKGVRK